MSEVEAPKATTARAAGSEPEEAMDKETGEATANIYLLDGDVSCWMVMFPAGW